MLKYSTYIAPAKPAVSDDLPPGELRRMWSPTSATLIYGAVGLSRGGQGLRPDGRG
jgi:hypothetical protein